MSGPEKTGKTRISDQGVFESLFRDFFPVLMAFAVKILGNEEDARDVVQKVFINLWEKREKLDLESSMKSYLFTAVHHRSLNVIRDRKKFDGNEMPEQDSGMDLPGMIEAAELETRIMEVIGGLPEKCRQIFVLNRFENLKYGEIAEKLGISEKTVENQISKALKVLREKLARYLAILVWLVLYALN